MALDNEILLETYRKMILVRAMENTHFRLLREGKIKVNPHLGKGQEAVSVGVTGPLRQDDILFGTHRGVGEYIGKGMRPKDIWNTWARRPVHAKARGHNTWPIVKTTSPV
jgi:TPP-dependent pyruvate/acetoin dehydrogenase alpha subunit